jgi:ABC-type uncharacterized transport system involved in gliding motility auxiliary subunit
MSERSGPPVPQWLYERLKDYPEHVVRLQQSLNDYARNPFKLMPFDGAVWAIEGCLEAFASEARREVREAEATGDAAALAQAKAKKLAFGSARVDMGDMTELLDYFGNGQPS